MKLSDYLNRRGSDAHQNTAFAQTNSSCAADMHKVQKPGRDSANDPAR